MFALRYWPTWLTVALLRVCALLPLSLSRVVGAALGLVMYASNRKRRRIARINLEECFPQQTAAERRRFLLRHFMAAGRAYVDLGFLAWGPQRRVLAKTRFSGLENYESQLKARRNVILLAPHSVGMNFGGSVLARTQPEFSMIKLQRNPVVNWLLNAGRARFGCQLITRKQGLRPVARRLQQGLAFYYLPDEDFGPKKSVFVSFFGVQTATLPTLGRLAKLANAVVVPCFTRLLPGGQGYEVVLRPVLEGFPHGDPVADAAHMKRALEEGIRLAPEQYMWTFKLFKTRPDAAPSPYSRRARKARARTARA